MKRKILCVILSGVLVFSTCSPICAEELLSADEFAEPVIMEECVDGVVEQVVYEQEPEQEDIVSETVVEEAPDTLPLGVEVEESETEYKEDSEDTEVVSGNEITEAEVTEEPEDIGETEESEDTEEPAEEARAFEQQELSVVVDNHKITAAGEIPVGAELKAEKITYTERLEEIIKEDIEETDEEGEETYNEETDGEETGESKEVTVSENDVDIAEPIASLLGVEAAEETYETEETEETEDNEPIGDLTITVYDAFDINIMLDGEVWQPVSDNKIVKITVTGVELPEEDTEEEIEVHRIEDDEESVILLNSEVIDREEGIVEFDTEHFTTFTISGKSYTVADDWYKYWQYELDDTNDYIKLKYYGIDNSGNTVSDAPTDVIVPATATINGRTYHTYVHAGSGLKITGKGYKDYYSAFDENDLITSVVFEDGTYIESKNVNKFSLNAFFSDCTSLISVNINGLSTTNGSKKVSNTGAMFDHCEALTTISWDSLDFSEDTGLEIMFFGCKSLKSVDLSAFTGAVSCGMLFTMCENLETVTLGNTSRVTDMSVMFANCTKLTSVTINNMDCVTTTNSMFNGCTSLTEVNFPDDKLNMVNVENASYMFANCSSLTTITGGTGGFTTEPFLNMASCTDMSCMFKNCTSLTSFEIFICTNSVTDMSRMFEGCTALEKMPFGSMAYHDYTGDEYHCYENMSNLVNTSYMFKDCTALNDVSNMCLYWDFSHVQNVSHMFENCTSLNVLDWGDTRYTNLLSVTDATDMLTGCEHLYKVRFSNPGARIDFPWDMHPVESDGIHASSYGAFSITPNSSDVGKYLYVPMFLNYYSESGTLLYDEYVVYEADASSLHPGTWYTSRTGAPIPNDLTRIVEDTNVYARGDITNTWDISAAQDGSIMAYWSESEAKLSIYGSGEIKDYQSSGSRSPFHALKDITFDVVMSDGITNIGEYLFYGCSKIEEIKLSKDITEIKKNAFYNCKNLVLTELPSGVTSIGRLAFQGCKNITLTSLPSGITSIGDSTFASCTNLALTSLPGGVTSIGVTAFCENVNLALTSLPENLTEIGNSAFRGCTNIALTSLPDGVTSLGNSVFRGCTNLALTSLPEGIVSIGTQTFSGCLSLSSITLPSSLESIAGNAFYDCDNLTMIIGGDNVTAVEANAFYVSDTTDTQLVTTSSALQNYGWSGSNRNVSIASQSWDISAASDRSIMAYWFADTGKLAIIGEGATRDYAEAGRSFGDFRNTTFDVEMSDGITYLGERIFKDCVNMTVSRLSKDIETIGMFAFDGCTSLELTELPEELKNIKTCAFQSCTSLSLTSLPDGVTTIGTYAFMYDTNLALSALPAGVTSIGLSAFRECTNITIEEIPEGITSIGDFTFYGCSNITSIILPDSLTSIKRGAFQGCNSLTTITGGNNISSLTQSNIFMATGPYNSTNLLATTLNTTNTVFTDYNWSKWNRKIVIPSSYTVLLPAIIELAPASDGLYIDKYEGEGYKWTVTGENWGEKDALTIVPYAVGDITSGIIAKSEGSESDLRSIAQNIVTLTDNDSHSLNAYVYTGAAGKTDATQTVFGANRVRAAGTECNAMETALNSDGVASGRICIKTEQIRNTGSFDGTVNFSWGKVELE